MWYALDELREQMEEFFEDVEQRLAGRNFWFYPPVNIAEDDEKLYIDVELPGIKPEDVEINVKGDELRIAGEFPKYIPDDVEVIKNETPRGKFERVVSLPFIPDADQVKAGYKNGILRIAIPHPKEIKPKKVDIIVE